MDSNLFDYPGASPAAADDAALLPDAGAAMWAVIRDRAPARRYREGEILLADSDAERCLWIVADGRVIVHGERRVHGELGAGGVFGELAFFSGEPARQTVRALTDVTVLRLTLEQFEALAGTDPALARHLLFDLARVLAVRLRDLRRLV